MWDGLIVLVLLCLVMASASYIVGSLPLTLTLTPRSLKLLTALGTGVLVGTALVVIIPEGVETLYSVQGSSHGHDKRALVGRSEPFVWTTISTPRAVGALSASTSADESAFNILPIGMGSPKEGDFGQHGHDSSYAAIHAADNNDHEDDSDTTQDNHNPHAYVGLAIILGFILMYLIDELPKHITPPSQPRRFQINLTSLSFNRAPAGSGDGAEGAVTENHDDGRASSTTVGLVIHAAADGIALGASSTSKSNLSFIIFIALMVHKAPAAFGLTSVLLKQGVSKRAAKAHLIIFSLAAPVGALATWAAAHLLGFGSMDSTSTEFVTGLLLLFSGGTFLYVAMHTMQDAPHHDADTSTNGFAEPSLGLYEPAQNNKSNGGGEGLTSIGVTALGMLLPLLTQFGHAH